MRQYEEGRVTSISSQEMMRVSRKYLPEYFHLGIRRLKTKGLPTGLPYRGGNPGTGGNPVHGPGPTGAGHGKFHRAQPLHPVYLRHQPGRAKRSPRTSPASSIGPSTRPSNWMRIFPVVPGSPSRSRTARFLSPTFTPRGSPGPCASRCPDPIRNPDEEIRGILGIDIKFEDLAKMEQDGEI